LNESLNETIKSGGGDPTASMNKGIPDDEDEEDQDFMTEEE
jgi:hypothetical protein